MAIELKMLSLYKNRLTTLPATIARLTALENLNVSCNELSSLPLELGALARLHTLDLGHNRLILVVDGPQEAAVERALGKNAGARAVGVAPALRNGQPVAVVKLLRDEQFLEDAETLN